MIEPQPSSETGDVPGTPESLAGDATALGSPPTEAAVALVAEAEATDASEAMAPSPEELTAQLRRRAWTMVGVVGGLMIASLVAFGFFYRTPYVALVPGSARDTEPLIEVQGIEDFPSDGEVLYTTVRLRQRPNLFEYVWTSFDDDAEIVPEEQILGDRTPEENRTANLELMAGSKEVAVAVALEQLGYETIAETGVFLREIITDSAADGVLEPGDIITEVEGVPVFSAIELVDALSVYGVGDTVTFTAVRIDSASASVFQRADFVDQTFEVTVQLGANPDDAERAFLGVAPQTLIDVETELPIDVAIQSGNVGGPSAGLAFTLAILDQLTEGELTGGRQVAVTGTINPNGAVGSVGGVPQKTAAVRDAGVDVFIVPAALGEERLAEIRERAGDDLEIVPVNSLQEALDALAQLGGDTDAIEEFAAGNPSLADS